MSSVHRPQLIWQELFKKKKRTQSKKHKQKNADRKSLFKKTRFFKHIYKIFKILGNDLPAKKDLILFITSVPSG